MARVLQNEFPGLSFQCETFKNLKKILQARFVRYCHTISQDAIISHPFNLAKGGASSPWCMYLIFYKAGHIAGCAI